MRPPPFWSRGPDRPGLTPRLLAPAAGVWRLVSECRRALATPVRLDAPVICVGNLTAGGAGKTPTVMALLQRLKSLGADAHVVSRGYGGSERGPHRVDLGADDATLVGDEPLMLAALAPTWVARDRPAGVRAALEAGARLALLDDGHQNPWLHKDLSIVVVDAGAGFGNGRVIPAGPLREPVEKGLSRANAIVIIGSDEEIDALLLLWPALRTRPLLRAELRPLPTGLHLDGVPVIAFAGIGRPTKFFETLRRLGAELRGAHAFPDHLQYSSAILRRLRKQAARADAMLVTTEKDAVRLPPDFRREVMALPVRLTFEDAVALDALLTPLLEV